MCASVIATLSIQVCVRSICMTWEIDRSVQSQVAWLRTSGSHSLFMKSNGHEKWRSFSLEPKETEIWAHLHHLTSYTWLKFLLLSLVFSTVLLTFLIIVIKSLTWSNLREEGFTLVHNLNEYCLWWWLESLGWQKPKVTCLYLGGPENWQARAKNETEL